MKKKQNLTDRFKINIFVILGTLLLAIRFYLPNIIDIVFILLLTFVLGKELKEIINKKW